MGSEVRATCECGLDTRILIGGGMENFISTCYFPCLCEACHDIVPVNLIAKRKRCPKCRGTKLIPYDDLRLSGLPGERTVAEWNVREQLGGELRLTDGSYKCPKCHELTLRFADSGLCWD